MVGLAFQRCRFHKCDKRGLIDITSTLFHVSGSIAIGAQPVPFSLFQDMKRILPFKTGNIYGITEGGGGGLINLAMKTF